jgi:hypothetical protein
MTPHFRARRGSSDDRPSARGPTLIWIIRDHGRTGTILQPCEPPSSDVTEDGLPER